MNCVQCESPRVKPGCGQYCYDCLQKFATKYEQTPHTTRASELVREAELIEVYLKQGFSLHQAENYAEADVQVEQYGSTHAEAMDKKYAYRD